MSLARARVRRCAIAHRAPQPRAFPVSCLGPSLAQRATGRPFICSGTRQELPTNVPTHRKPSPLEARPVQLERRGTTSQRNRDCPGFPLVFPEPEQSRASVCHASCSRPADLSGRLKTAVQEKSAVRQRRSHASPRNLERWRCRSKAQDNGRPARRLSTLSRSTRRQSAAGRPIVPPSST